MPEDSFYLIKSVEAKTSSKGGMYLDFVLADKNGDIPAKLWDYTPSRHGEFKPDMVVKVRGTLEKWKDRPQLRIEKLRPAEEGDGVRAGELVPCAPGDPQLMLDEITAIVRGFSDEELKTVTLMFLERGRDKLLIWPAAVKLHHAVRGGLLQHILTVARMALQACLIYPFLNRDLLLAGVILHDMAKLDEYGVSDLGVAGEYTAGGILMGHPVRGALQIELFAREAGIGDETVLLLQHMLLSHHGVPEFGSPVRPAFMEAEVLSALDTLDAKLYEMVEALGQTEKGSFSPRQWALDNRRLYNHGKTGDNAE